MAVTNKQIIETYRALNGIMEPIHTYAAWKSLGYQVRKGEKSADKIKIWKHKTRTVKGENGVETETSKMLMTTAAFFRQSQVEPI